MAVYQPPCRDEPLHLLGLLQHLPIVEVRDLLWNQLDARSKQAFRLACHDYRLFASHHLITNLFIVLSPSYSQALERSAATVHGRFTQASSVTIRYDDTSVDGPALRPDSARLATTSASPPAAACCCRLVVVSPTTATSVKARRQKFLGQLGRSEQVKRLSLQDWHVLPPGDLALLARAYPGLRHFSATISNTDDGIDLWRGNWFACLAQGWPALESLQVHACCLRCSSETLLDLPQLTHLKYLQLVGVMLREDTHAALCQALGGLTSLTCLDLNLLYAKNSGEEPPVVQADGTIGASLITPSSALQPATILCDLGTVLRQLPALTSITLHLCGTHFLELAPLLQPLAGAPCLARVSLPNSQLTSAALAALQQLPAIEHIEFASTADLWPPSEEVLSQHPGIGAPLGLRSVRLSFCPLSDLLLMVPAAGLQRLDVRYVQTCAEQVVTTLQQLQPRLAACSYVKVGLMIDAVDARGDLIAPAGDAVVLQPPATGHVDWVAAARALGGVGGLEDLYVYDMTCAGFTDADLGLLARSCIGLQRLVLYESHVTDAGLLQLLQLPRLQWVRLRACTPAYSAAGLVQLAWALQQRPVTLSVPGLYHPGALDECNAALAAAGRRAVVTVNAAGCEW